MDPELMILADAEDAARRGAALWVDMAAGAASRRGRFAAALSGGSTPRPLHRLFASRAYAERIPWDRVDLFWADERMVPPDDAASNYGAARKDFIESVPIAPSRVHPMPFMAEPPAAAAQYQLRIERVLGAVPVFDLVLLGLGADGHTASLFPGRPEPADPDKWVSPAQGGSPPAARLTLTPPLINRSRCVCFFVTGKDKAEAVARVVAGRDRQLPAAWIEPKEGRLLWVLDRAAAKAL